MKKQKYPRTMNLPNSGSDSSDDVWWKNFDAFEGKQVVVTEKLDGENTTVYPDGSIHARSLDSRHHPSRSWMKSFASEIGYKIPEGMRICGENVFAFHSILYTELESYFYAFGVYEGDRCLSWEETKLICDDVGIMTAPVLYEGIWNPELVKEEKTGTYPNFRCSETKPILAFPECFEECGPEGFVVRIQDSFDYKDFKTCCAKYVSSQFKGLMRDTHWSSMAVFPNILKED